MLDEYDDVNDNGDYNCNIFLLKQGRDCNIAICSAGCDPKFGFCDVSSF